MSSYLWRYYLENDVERFQRLLQGSQSNPHTSAHRGSTHKPALTTPTGSFKSSSVGLAVKHRPGSPSVNATLTSKMLKELDSMGRTVLHLACTEPDRLPFVTALLSHPLMDPSVVDLESGWTALHRALYHGNISTAREIMSSCPANYNLLKSKDHAGDSPWEVFEATVHEIQDTFNRNHSSDVGEYSDSEEEADSPAVAEKGLQTRGDEVFAWGSNKNLNLGFVGGDDRSYPERVPLQRPRSLLLEQAKRRYSHLPRNQGKSAEQLIDAFILFNPLQISDIHLSKFHTAIVTTDPHSNLFLCGFGRGGRLGFGDEQNVQFTFRPLLAPLLPKKRVQEVALGQDHTVVVLDGGEVWTWGSNQAGQLGYALPQKTSKEESNQCTPRQVFGLIKREPIIGCAASRIHTAVFTENALFTFGKNDGQLGILDSSDATTLEIQSTPRKVSANFLNGTKIKEVIAIDKATIILLESHEVWILAGHAYSRLSFPMERFVGLPEGAKNITRYDTGSNAIKMITGGGDTLCALSEVGNVFAVDVDAALKERAVRGFGKVAWSPQRAWSLRKRHMAVRDVDVGADGNIIICTQSGSVWRRVKRVKIKEGGGDGGRYKFDRVPGLTRITTVRSNTAGAFAVIRRDSDLMQKGLTVEPQGLWEDANQMLSFGELFEDNEDAEGLGLANDNDDEWGYGPKPRPKQYDGAVKWFMQGMVEEDIRAHLSDLEPHKESGGWDMSVSTSKCGSIDLPVHSFILSRSRVLRKLIAQGSGNVVGICEVLPTKCGLRVVFHDIELLTLLNLVYYLYIDTVIDLWHQRNISKHQANFFRTLRSEMARVSTALELKHLAKAVGRMHYPPRCMDKDLQSAYMDPDFFHTADMIIDVADGESIAVHSALMRMRCPFFEALYGGGARGRWLLGRQEGADSSIHVDMKHVEREIMEMVVSWLYYDWDAEGFDGVRVGVKDGNVDQYLDFALDVLSTANELMLDRLSQVCQKVVGRYVNIRNAAGLLTAVAPCSEKDFKGKCLQYICSNLEVMLEHQ
ncbi:regulator of chromosome condensation 1/beta-lactamase-inhibitor protein II [Trichophaea hybrida]|nr:regulator of chromosome condensation 1/beta-lactamase-inhibitor protein II [Trichophaea hybrida]